MAVSDSPATPEAAVAAAASAGQTITVESATEIIEAARVAAKAGIDIDVAEAIRNGMSARDVKAAALDAIADRSASVPVITARPVPASGTSDDGWNAAFNPSRQGA